MNTLLSCMIAVAACNPVNDRSTEESFNNAENLHEPHLQADGGETRRPGEASRNLPARYVKAFMCDFDENPVAAANRYHRTPAGRAKRDNDLALMRSLGFARKGRDGDLESAGGKIAAPPGMTIFGLPVRFLEMNGMIGDANSMYVTTFANGVTVAQVVKAAHLEMDRASYRKYNIRHYSRHVLVTPYVEAYLDDRGGRDVLLTCQVQATPD